MDLTPQIFLNPGSLFNAVFVGAIFGFILSLPVALFLVFWLSAVKSRSAVVWGAFVGSIIGLFIVLAWAGTLIYDTVLPGADGTSAFFGTLFICSITGLSAGILSDLLVARFNPADYRRRSVAHQ